MNDDNTIDSDDKTVDEDVTKPITDELSWHEAMDRAHLATDFFDRFVANHPAIEHDTDLATEATQITGALAEFYQKVGQKRFMIGVKNRCPMKTPLGPCPLFCEPGKNVCESHTEVTVSPSNRQRSKGVIDRILYDNDHGNLYVHGHFEHVGYTGFGGIVFDDRLRDAFEREVSAIFGVETLDECVGKECYGLWCRGRNNEHMAGIETKRGRVTLAGFTKKYCSPDRHHDERRFARDSIESTIRWAKRRLTEETAALATLNEDIISGKFINWETAPDSTFDK